MTDLKQLHCICPTCKGSIAHNKENCLTCKGEGQVNQEDCPACNSSLQNAPFRAVNYEKMNQHIESLEGIIQRLHELYNAYSVVGQDTIAGHLESQSDELQKIKQDYIKDFYPNYYD